MLSVRPRPGAAGRARGAGGRAGTRARGHGGAGPRDLDLGPGPAPGLEPAARLPLTPGAEVVVHPAATFEVELSARVPDARLVLVDGRDDLVPASGTREVAAGTKLTLAPAAPLVPASRYVLRLDGAVDRELHDDAGRVFSAVSLPLLAAGSPPPPEAKKPARKKKRR